MKRNKIYSDIQDLKKIYLTRLKYQIQDLLTKQKSMMQHILNIHDIK